MSVVSFALAVVFIIRLLSTSAFRVPKLYTFIKKYTHLLHDVFNWVIPVAILEWKNWEGEALRGQQNVSPAW